MSGSRLEHVLAAGYAHHQQRGGDVGVSFKDLLRRSNSAPAARSSKDDAVESEHSKALRRRQYERAKTEVVARRETSPANMTLKEWLAWLQNSPKHILVRWYNKLRERVNELKEKEELLTNQVNELKEKEERLTNRTRAIDTRVRALMEEEQAARRRR